MVWPGSLKTGTAHAPAARLIMRVQTAHAPLVEKKLLYQAGPEEILARAAWPTKDREETRLGVKTRQGGEAAKMDQQTGEAQGDLEEHLNTIGRRS